MSVLGPDGRMSSLRVDATGRLLVGIGLTTGAPTDAPALGTVRIDPAANRLWAYCATGWKSVLLG
jgi:hypothetical protein